MYMVIFICGFVMNSSLVLSIIKMSQKGKVLLLFHSLAQLPGAVEYTDCISAEPPPPLDMTMTLNNLMVRLQ